MDELIFRVLSGNASPSEEERVRHWRAESPENEAYFRSARGVWSLTKPRALSELPAPPSADVLARAWERQREEAASASITSLAERRSGPAPGAKAIRWSLALAAALAAVALGVRVVGIPGRGPQPLAVFEADASAPATAILDDGSRVRLAPGSRLERWAAEDQRQLTLTGRAFFAVAHDPERPFVVKAAGAEARVLGTRFELFQSDGSLRTVVVDGRVSVSNDRGRVEIPAGGVGRSVAGQPPTTEPADDVYALLDWPSGLLLFQGTPLSRVAEDVGRHFGMTILVAGASLQALRISASFEEEGFEEIVQALCEVAAADCSLTDSGASIRPAS